MSKYKHQLLDVVPVRSCCPIASTLDIIGDKWTLLIVRDLFAGKVRYKDLVASPEKIATNTLASRLQKLVDIGLVSAERSDARIGATEYHLTEIGRSLLPLLAAVKDWGLAHIPSTETRVKMRNS